MKILIYNILRLGLSFNPDGMGKMENQKLLENWKIIFYHGPGKNSYVTAAYVLFERKLLGPSLFQKVYC